MIREKSSQQSFFQVLVWTVCIQSQRFPHWLHPDDRACHWLQGNYAGALPLYKRSLDIDKKVHGPDHPHVATSANNLAGVLKKLVRPK